MKIAFLISDYAPSRGGQERYLSRLLGALAAGGHDLHVFAARGEMAEGGGFVFHRVPVTAAAGPSLKNLLFIRRGRPLLAGGGGGVVGGLPRFFPPHV